MEKASDRIAALFEGSETLHGTHGQPELDENGVKWNIKKTARTLKGAATPLLWSEHLLGKKPLGVIPIKNDSMCRWGSADIDEYDVDAVAVVQRVDAAKLPLVPGRSKSGGLHLFLFAKEPVPAELMQGTLREIAASLGFAGCEIFPKQTRILAEAGDQGNWMLMPYFGSDYGGKLRFQYGLKKTGAEMTLSEFCTAAERHSLTAEEISAVRARLLRGEETTTATKSKRKKKADAGGDGDDDSADKGGTAKEPFHNGPPCLQHMARGGFPDGGRNNALFHIGVFLRRAHPDDWQQRVYADNGRFMRPPLPEDEVKSVIRSLEKKGYEYTCNNEPMAKHCNHVVCRSRKFGVGAGGAYPVIESMAKLLTDPPLWFIQIPGSRVMVKNDDLQFYRKFHTACTGTHPSVCFKLITDKEWISILGEAMKNADPIEAPPEIGRGGIFRELLENFLTNRTIGEKKEDLLRNVPWEDDEGKRFVFSMKALEDYVRRENIQPRFTRPELSEFIKKVGGLSIQMDVKNQRNVRLWEVPSDKITRAPDLDPPNEEREVI